MLIKLHFFCDGQISFEFDSSFINSIIYLFVRLYRVLTILITWIFQKEAKGTSGFGDI